MKDDIKLVILKNLLAEVSQKYDDLLGEKEEELKKHFEKAIKDSLTGIYNRFYFFESIESKIPRYKRENKKLIVAFVDLDNFKQVNDTLGHDVGDEVLKDVVKIIKESIREYDMVARYGGDEFILYFDTENIEIVEKILKRIVEKIDSKLNKYKISASYGLAVYPDDGESVEKLLKIADERMYAQKIDKKSKKILHIKENK